MHYIERTGVLNAKTPVWSGGVGGNRTRDEGLAEPCVGVPRCPCSCLQRRFRALLSHLGHSRTVTHVEGRHLSAVKIAVSECHAERRPAPPVRDDRADRAARRQARAGCPGPLALVLGEIVQEHCARVRERDA